MLDSTIKFDNDNFKLGESNFKSAEVSAAENSLTSVLQLSNDIDIIIEETTKVSTNE